MSLVWWLLVVLVAVGVAILLSPVDVELMASSTTERPYRVRLRGLYGLARLDLSPPSRAAAAPSPPRAAAPAARPPLTRVARALAMDGVLAALLRLARRLLRSVRIRRLHVDATYGTGDPADTGRLHGALSPLLAVLPRSRNVHADVRPDFLEARLDGSVDAVVRIAPVRIALAVLAFAATPAVLRGAYHVAVGR